MKVLICLLNLCIFAEAVNYTDFFECGKEYAPCHIIRYPKEHNPYKAAIRKTPLMRKRAHGYLQIRPGVHLFYQLYYANGIKDGAFNKPLLIWIQGGPGFAASGLANFAEIGPLDMDFKPRNHTWVKGRNLLLIDHPVGTGFSYADNDTLLVNSDRDMAIDLSKAIKMFLRRRSDFRRTPAYIIGQSYGGKITPRLALYLYTAIRNKKLEMNFKGIAIGGGWVNPRESVLTQPDCLYHKGLIDRDLYINVKRISLKLARALDQNSQVAATILDDLLFQTINKDRPINFNNAFAEHPYDALDFLNKKINLFVKPTLRNVNQSIYWRYLSMKPYQNLKSNFLYPSYSFLEKLLDYSDLKIVVYNGNLDIITPVAGASNWVHKLRWHGAANFATAKRHEIHGKRNGFYKEWERLSFWSVFGAGHWVQIYTRMERRFKFTCEKLQFLTSDKKERVKIGAKVPEDNPEAMEHILKHLTAEDLDLRSIFIPPKW